MPTYEVVVKVGNGGCISRKLTADRFVQDPYGLRFENGPPNTATTSVAVFPYDKLLAVVDDAAVAP